MRRLILLFALAACDTPAVLTPPSTTGCRLNEQECNDHACCPLNDFVCGGDDPHCFTGYCCPTGGPLGPQAQRSDAGPPPGAIEKRHP